MAKSRDVAGFGSLRTFGLMGACGLFGVGAMYSPALVQGSKKKKQKATVAAKVATPSFDKELKPLVDKFCGKCHYDAKDPSGDLNLAKFNSLASIQANTEIWEKVLTNVSSGHMPPEGSPAPTGAQRAKIASFIETALAGNCKLSEPGRVTMRRLNREEYNNTIRDLMGVDLRPADDFPSDDVGHGFDNIGDVLSVSPLLMEKYLTAAEKVAETAISIPVRIKERLEAGAFKSKVGAVRQGAFIVSTNGEAVAKVKLPRTGQYKLRVQLFGEQAGPDPVKAIVKFGDQAVDTLDIREVKRNAVQKEYTVFGRAGEGEIHVEYLNDFFDKELPKGKQDRNLGILGAEIEGPTDGGGPMPASHRRIIPVDPTESNEDAVAKADLKAFASRAYRRPATTEDVDRLMAIYNVGKKTGEVFERRMQLAVTAALVSPHFLYRVEADNAGTRALTGYEMATRLSYFLWSSSPDDQLLALAASNKLQNPTVLSAQVQRMLADPRSRALTDNFGGQWLTLRLLNNVSPDPAQFKDWSEEMRSDMATETKMFFESVKRENRSVLDFIEGRFSFMNERLAKHYGIEGVTGPEFRKVVLTDPNRGGILTQGAVLTLTSNPTRTSPVKRGKWVLEQILGTPPPPPPPGVPDLKEAKAELANQTVRQRLEAHRANPACAACHARMDPLGFGLENFDAVGRWRTQDEGRPIDSSGVLPGGKTFSGPAQLRTILLSNKSLFVKNLADKLLTYGLGRGLTITDKCALDGIVKKTVDAKYRFAGLVTAVVLSDPFRMRKGEGAPRP